MRYAAGVSAVILFFSFQLQSFVFMAASVFPLVQFFATAAIFSALAATEDARMRPGWVIASGRELRCGLVHDDQWPGRADRDGAGVLVPACPWSTIADLRSPGQWRGPRIPRAGRPAVAPRSGAASGPTAPAPRLAAMLVYFLTFFASGAAYASVAAATVLGTLLLAAGTVAILITLADRTAARPAGHLRCRGDALRDRQRGHGDARRARSSAPSRRPSHATPPVRWLTGRDCSCGPSAASGIAGRSGPRRLASATTLAISVLALVPHVAIAMVWKAKADNIAAAILRAPKQVSRTTSG